MRILGLDPGLSVTGYGLIETAPGTPHLIEAGCFRNPASWPLEKRLLELHAGVQQVIQEGKPDCVAVEALFSNYKHPTSALQMAHARGVLLLAASEAGLPVFSYAPARVKKSLTGRGAAAKPQIQKMIQSVFSLDEAPSPPDVADALAVALCHAGTLHRGRLGLRRKTQAVKMEEILLGVGKKR